MPSMETKHNTAPRAGGSRWLRRLAYLLAGMLALGVLAWGLVPPILKSQAEKFASEQLGRKLTVGSVDFKPWTLELEIKDLAMSQAGGSGEQLKIGRVYVNAELQSLMRLAPVVDAVEMEGVRGNVVHLGGGKYDFDDVLAKIAALPKSPESEAQEPLKFAIYNIAFKDWALQLDDKAVGKKHALSDFQLSLPFLSNMEAQREVKTQPRLAFTLNGSRFDSSGETTPFVQTRQSDAKIKIASLDLAPYLPYLPANLPFKLTSAVLGADLAVAFEQNPKPTVRITGQMQADNLSLQDALKAPLFAMKNLSIVASDVRPLSGFVALQSVTLQAPQLQLRRNAAGQLNLQSTPPHATKKIAHRADSTLATGQKGLKNSEQTPWQISIEQVSLEGGSVTWSDETTQPRAALAAQAINMQAKQIAWPFAADKPILFEGASQVAQGSLSFSGTATDVQASVTTQLKGLPLAAFAPYLNDVLMGSLTGAADVQAGVFWRAGARADEDSVKKTGPGAQKAALQITLPKAQLANVQLSSKEPARGKTPLAQMKLLSVDNAQIDVLAQTVKLAKIAATGVQTRVERNAQGRWMAQDWLKAAASSANAASASANASSANTGPQSLASNAKAAGAGAGASAGKSWKVSLGEISLDAPQLAFVDRFAGGAAERSLASGAAPAANVSASANATASASPTTEPAAPSDKAVKLNISQLKARVLGIELDGEQLAAKPLAVSLNAALAQADDDGKPLGEPGKIEIKGQIAPAPLAMQLDAQLSRLPIHAFEPYFADALNIDLLRLEAGFTGKLQLAQTPQGLQLKLSGDALAEELQTTLRGAALAASSGAVEGDELLNWKALNVKALNVEMSPGAALKIDLGEAALTDFFARILISEQGRINLSDIVKSGGSSAASATGRTTTAATNLASVAVKPAVNASANSPTSAVTSPAAAASALSSTINTIAPRADSTLATGQNDLNNNASSSPEPIINIGAVSLINGKVFFADRFIKPNYAANLSELSGKLGAFSSQAVAGTVQMADLELRGKAEGTASLEILGQVNPLAKPLALNITGKVRDLELAPLSPYSVKYAGHGIERGKLSVDVKYLVKPDGQLTASNNIVLNQIKFGDKVEGAPNSLPVKLAVALLADRNGVIDINLPIQGSLNDPQFSIGPIVFKLIINLVVKAITSPFSLLASAFGGGGDELSQVAFEPGKAQIADSAKPGMEKIVKALQDRPNLKMTVIGQAGLEVEREAYKKERLKALVAAEKRRNVVASGSSAGATQTAAITVSDAEYPALLKEVYKRADVPKPRNAIGFVKDIAAPEMEALLLASLPVTEQAMQELALARGLAVRDYLAAKGLPIERLFLGAAKAVGKEEKWQPKAELSLAAP